MSESPELLPKLAIDFGVGVKSSDWASPGPCLVAVLAASKGCVSPLPLSKGYLCARSLHKTGRWSWAMRFVTKTHALHTPNPHNSQLTTYTKSAEEKDTMCLRTVSRHKQCDCPNLVQINGHVEGCSHHVDLGVRPEE